MPSRKVNLVEGEYYHLFNRGVDKRDIFMDKEDVERFHQCMIEFNTKVPIGSIYENSFLKEKEKEDTPLVSFISYCLNPNHYHHIMTPLVEKGIESFMQRLGTGYTLYFNNKYKRSGSLFQGKFKASHIDSNEYLLHVSAYVNLNDKTHQLGGSSSKLVRSSWDEYRGIEKMGICNKDIILNQFKNSKEYEQFALSSLIDIQERKKDQRELQDLLID
ncbi:MAG TPA: transposase [Candidatus Paceibacterota bacterium]